MVNVGCAEEVAAAFLQHPMYFPEKFNWTLNMLEHVVADAVEAIAKAVSNET